ncbi:hypothetical protein ABCR94_33905 [Streptomyces sp. 21So2-11]|uniref:hypothetical protein n=1 Tax=Streptomyces sp. 21So2-11 TaxID=3144408 RepID=UPI00321B2DBA
MLVRKFMVMMTAIVALVAGPVLTGSASAAPESQPSPYTAQALDAGLTSPQAAQLQQQVDSYLAKHSEARQVSANKLAIGGGSLTLAAPGQQPARDLAAPSNSALLPCASGHLCIRDGYGNNYDYYYCGYYSFGGAGDGTFNNNQSWGTRARFYNSNGTERWSHVAKGSGTASWTPVYYIRPC